MKIVKKVKIVESDLKPIGLIAWLNLRVYGKK